MQYKSLMRTKISASRFYIEILGENNICNFYESFSFKSMNLPRDSILNQFEFCIPYIIKHICNVFGAKHTVQTFWKCTGRNIKLLTQSL